MSAMHTRVRVGNGLTFEVYEWGRPDGTPLLCLHGFPQCGRSWTGLAERLAAAGFRVVAFDQRGYSDDAQPSLTTYTLDNVVQDALAVADRLGLDSFHLAGFGMGALQGWQLAGAYPQRVASLVALRFPHPRAFAEALETDPHQQAAWSALEHMSPPEAAARGLLADGGAGLRAFLLGSGLPVDLTESTITRIGTQEVLSAALAWHLIPVADMARVPDTIIPTLYVWSEGPALTSATARRCGAHVRADYAEVELAGAGHWLLETAADRLAPVIRQHVEPIEVSR